MNQPIMVRALDNILNRFYRLHTSTLFITVESTLNESIGPKPLEIAGEML